MGGLGMITIRALRASDTTDVFDLLTRAFGAPAEARLVEDLRESGAMAAERVLTLDGRVVSYAALSWMSAPNGWLCLAPVATDTGAGRQGYASALVSGFVKTHGCDHMIVVLGDPAFYGRCGFDSARARNLISPYPVSHMLVAGPGDGAPRVRLDYPAAFQGL